MQKRFLNTILFAILAGISWLANNYFPDYELQNLTRSLVALTIAYVVFQLIIRAFIDKRAADRKAKHLFRRLNNSAFYVLTIFWLLTIWVENTETLLLSYGLVSAAVALALQDVFKDLIGGFVLLGNRNYRIGDRIEVGDLVGDVVKINLLYTTVLEIRNWVAGDQPTGRLSIVPNSTVSRAIVHNYTKDHKFIWDEIVVPITYQSDWQRASEIIRSVLVAKQVHIDENVAKQMKILSRKYYLEEKITEPNVFIEVTDNWVTLYGRYITKTLDRRETKSDISKEILTRLQGEDTIQIASETLKIVQ